MFITVYNSFPVLFLLLPLTFYFPFIVSSSDLALFFFCSSLLIRKPIRPPPAPPPCHDIALSVPSSVGPPFTTIPITKLHEFLVTQRHARHLAGAV